ncbi:ANR family transcriptional regulator [Salmonella enterica subsp. enterica]|nr:ANR family transcriptional regulator [Salmonella enterica subsp. enterica]
MCASISGLATAISMCRSLSTSRRCDMEDVSDYARSTYRCYAVGAARCEQAGKFREAAELWLKASERPCKSRARKWAEDRADFCRRAATGRWRDSYGRKRV